MVISRGRYRPVSDEKKKRFRDPAAGLISSVKRGGLDALDEHDASAGPGQEKVF